MSAPAAARLAADAVGPPPRPARPLPARHRDRRHRPRPRPRRALERPDRAGRTSSRSPSTRCWSRRSAATLAPGCTAGAAASSCCCTTRPNTSSATSSRRSRRRSATPTRASSCACSPRSAAASASPAPTPAVARLVKRADRIAAHLEAMRLAGFAPDEASAIFGRHADLPEPVLARCSTPGRPPRPRRASSPLRGAAGDRLRDLTKPGPRCRRSTSAPCRACPRPSPRPARATS